MGIGLLSDFSRPSGNGLIDKAMAIAFRTLQVKAYLLIGFDSVDSSGDLYSPYHRDRTSSASDTILTTDGR